LKNGNKTKPATKVIILQMEKRLKFKKNILKYDDTLIKDIIDNN
jgi:hypothetical protein